MLPTLPSVWWFPTPLDNKSIDGRVTRQANSFTMQHNEKRCFLSLVFIYTVIKCIGFALIIISWNTPTSIKRGVIHNKRIFKHPSGGLRSFYSNGSWFKNIWVMPLHLTCCKKRNYIVTNGTCLLKRRGYVWTVPTCQSWEIIQLPFRSIDRHLINQHIVVQS